MPKKIGQTFNSATYAADIIVDIADDAETAQDDSWSGMVAAGQLLVA